MMNLRRNNIETISDDIQIGDIVVYKNIKSPAMCVVVIENTEDETLKNMGIGALCHCSWFNKDDVHSSVRIPAKCLKKVKQTSDNVDVSISTNWEDTKHEYGIYDHHETHPILYRTFINAIRSNKKIEAIKAHRSLTGYSLIDSKEAVEEIERRRLIV